MNKLSEPSFLQFIVDLLYRKMIDPTSSYYLPKLIQEQKTPTYEPYEIEGTFGPITMTGKEARTGGVYICTGINEEFAPDPDKPTVISFSDVKVVGLSNVLPNPATVSESDLVSVSATFSTVESSVYPKPMVIEGDFALEQSCCPSKDRETCSGASQPYKGEGTFKAEIKQSAIAGKVQLAVSPDGEHITATVTSLDFSVAKPEDVQVSVTITSIADPTLRQIWSEAAATTLNTPEGIEELVNSVKTVLDQESIRSSLSKLLTEKLSELIPEAT